MSKHPSGVSETDRERLELFRKNTLMLQDDLRKHLPKKTTISWKVDQETKVQGDIEPIIEAGLITHARLLIGNDQPANFYRAVNTLSKHHRGDKEKVERLREYKRVWKKVFGPNLLFRIGTEEDGLTNEKVFDMFANGYHLHNDAEKAKRFKELDNSWTRPMIGIQLQSMLMNISALCGRLAVEFVEPLLSEENGSP